MIMKRLFLFLAAGAALGTILSAWLSPQVIAWWFTPPVDLAVTCKAAVEWGIYTYRDVIVGGAVGGLATALVAFILWQMKSKKVPQNPGTGPT